MAELVIEDGNLIVRMSRRENVMALHRDVVVPLENIAQVRSVPEVRREFRGLRVPGYELFGRKLGTWRTRGAKDFVLTESYGEGLVIELNNHTFDRIVTTLSPPAGLLTEV